MSLTAEQVTLKPPATIYPSLYIRKKWTLAYPLPRELVVHKKAEIFVSEWEKQKVNNNGRKNGSSTWRMPRMIIVNFDNVMPIDSDSLNYLIQVLKSAKKKYLNTENDLLAICGLDTSELSKQDKIKLSNECDVVYPTLKDVLFAHN